MINFNKDPLPNFTKSTNRDFAKKDTNFKKFPKKDYKGKAFNKQPKKGSYKKPFKKGKHKFFKKPKKKLIKKIRTPEERKLAKERRKQRKLARRRQKFWYRNLPKVHKKWLRFSYNIKKVANPRLAIWAPFFQKDNSLRSLFLFRELTLTPVLWEQPKEWKNVFRIALFYRKLGLITRVNFDNLRESLSIKPVKRKSLQKKRYTAYMRSHVHRLGFQVKRGSRLAKRFKKYAFKLKVFHRKLYKHKKYSKLGILQKRYLLRKKNWPLMIELQPHRLTIKRILNNVFVVLTAVKTGNVIISRSAGCVGFSGSKKTTHITAEKVVNAVAKQALELNIFRLDVVIQSAFIDKYVKTALSGLRGVSKVFTKKIITKKRTISRIRRRFLTIKNILVQISTSHNGMRKPKKRRV